MGVVPDPHQKCGHPGHGLSPFFGLGLGRGRGVGGGSGAAGHFQHGGVHLFHGGCRFAHPFGLDLGTLAGLIDLPGQFVGSRAYHAGHAFQAAGRLQHAFGAGCGGAGGGSFAGGLGGLLVGLGDFGL